METKGKTKGADGECLDIFIGPNPESEAVFLVDQINQKTGKFDEIKVLLGWNNAKDALASYASCYPKTWKCGQCAAMTMDQFKLWLEKGNTAKPACGVEMSTAPFIMADDPIAQSIELWREFMPDALKGLLEGERELATKPAPGQHGLWLEEEPRDESGKWTTGGEKKDNKSGEIASTPPDKPAESSDNKPVETKPQPQEAKMGYHVAPGPKISGGGWRLFRGISLISSHPTEADALSAKAAAELAPQQPVQDFPTMDNEPIKQKPLASDASLKASWLAKKKENYLQGDGFNDEDDSPVFDDPKPAPAKPKAPESKGPAIDINSRLVLQVDGPLAVVADHKTSTYVVREIQSGRVVAGGRFGSRRESFAALARLAQKYELEQEGK